LEQLPLADDPFAETPSLNVYCIGITEIEVERHPEHRTV
jgi:phage terminase large subunit-like protein